MLSRIKYLKVFIKDPDKKTLIKLVKELIMFSWAKKSFPTDYFRKFLYRKTIKDYTSYLSIKEYYSIIESPKMVFPEVSKTLENKLAFYEICKKNKIPTPEIVCYNNKNTFVFKDASKLIKDTSELILFFEKVWTSYNRKKLFTKPVDGIGGMGCFILKKKSFKKYLKKNTNRLLIGNYVFQEILNQHSEINKIHSKSINSIRIDTFIDRLNKTHVLSATMRFGIGKEITDNLSSNGFHVSVNTQNGTLQGFGRQDFSRGGAVFQYHPDSKYKLEGFQIPYFKEACQLVKKANSFFPNRIVGWDVAITESGPVIIEGNHNPSLHMTDIACGGYKKHPLIKEILNEIKN
jgi:hypothetical protein